MVTVRKGQGSEGAGTAGAHAESGDTAGQPVLSSHSALTILRMSGGQALLYSVLLILLIVTFVPIV